MAYLFISHSSVDRALSEALGKWLRGIGHECVFLDSDADGGLTAGESWEARLYTELSRCRALIALVTPNWLESAWCTAEASHAQAHGKPIFELRLPGIDEDLVARRAPPALRSPQRINWDGSEAARKRLQDGLVKAGLDPRNLFEPVAGQAPYPGLAAFERADAALYFGRDKEIAVLQEMLRDARGSGQHRFIIVQGASGSGKSSLVRAGLLPRLEKNAETWALVKTFRPKADPLRSLAEALRTDPRTKGVRLPPSPSRPPKETARLVPWREDWTTWILDATDALRLHAGHNEATALVVVDQLEEALQGAAGTEFLCILRDVLVRREGSELLAIATIRTDFAEQLSVHPMVGEPPNTPPDEAAEPEAGLLPWDTYAIPPMPQSAIAEIITEPAKQVGLTIEQALVAQLQADTRTRDALPLLAFTLRELWDKHGKDDLKLTLAEYDTFGGLEKAVASRADAVMRDLQPPLDVAQEDAFRAFLLFRMMEISADGTAVRRPVARKDVPASVARVVEAFVEARLMFVAEGIIEIAHEAMFRTWARLAGWIETARTDLQLRRRASEAAAVWDVGGREDGRLWRSPDLDLLEAYDQRNPGTLQPATAAFLTQSRRTAEARREAEDAAQAALRRATAEAIENESLALVALSDNARRQGRGLEALKLALASWPRDATDGRPQLQRAIDAMGLATGEQLDVYFPIRRGSSVHFASFSADGSRIVTASMDHTARLYEVRLYDTITAASIGSPMAHGGEVKSAAFSPDGTRIVTASHDGTAQLWDAVTGTAIGSPIRHKYYVCSAEFNSDGTKFVTASLDGTAQLCDGFTGVELGPPMIHGNWVYFASFSPDGTRILTICSDGKPRLWDAVTCAMLSAPIWHDAAIISAAFSPDGTRIVTASGDSMARLWDAATGAMIGLPVEHVAAVTSKMFSPDGARVLTAGKHAAQLRDAFSGDVIGPSIQHGIDVDFAVFSPSGTQLLIVGDLAAQLWDAATGRAIGPPIKHVSRIYSAAVSPDGAWVLTTSYDGGLRLRGAVTSTANGLLMQHESEVISLSFSLDGTRVVTASSDRTARLWDGATGAVVGLPMRHDDVVISAAFSPDGMRILTVSQDFAARLWDAVTGTAIGLPMQHEYHVSSTAFSLDGKQVLTAGGQTVRLWDTVTAVAIRPPLYHGDSVHSVAFSPDFTRIVTAHQDNVAQLWGPVTGLMSGTPMQHGGPVIFAAFSPDGSKFLTVCQDYNHSVQLWDAATGTAVGQSMHHDGHVISAAFSPDGTKVLTVCYDGPVRLWDAVIGDAAALPMHHDSHVISATFSPDGARVLTNSEDHTARLWDTCTGDAAAPPMNHGGRVTSASFSPDGTRIVTVCMDGSMRLWDAATGAVIGPPMRYGSDVTSAVFKPDGTRVATASTDGTIRLWDVGWPKGPITSIAHALLPEIRAGLAEVDLSGLTERYGITIRDPIGQTQPPFDPARIDRR